VDDRASSLHALASMLTSWDVEFRATTSGAEALELVQAGERFDVVFVDYIMPKMCGLLVAEEIKRVVPSQVLVLMTFPMARSSNLTSIFTDFLLKPVKWSVFQDLLARLLSPKSDAKAKPIFRSPLKVNENASLLRILIAEDNVLNQKVVVHMLARYGYKGDLVNNGSDAIRAVAQHHYDVILMDMHMPEMGGIEATKEICRLWTIDQRPWIIAMTADALMESRNSCLEAGMDDYITKPIDMRLLGDVLSKCQVRKPRPDISQSSPIPVVPAML